MKFYYVIKQYTKVTFQCLRYIYKFNKLGTIRRFALLLTFPAIANILNIANAHLADTLQKTYGTGIMSTLIPIFMVIIGVELLDTFFSFLSRKTTYQWRNELRVLLDIERNKKKANMTIPFTDSEDNEQFNQRVQLNGDGFGAQISLISNLPYLISILVNIIFSAYIISAFNPLFALIIFACTIPSFYVAFTEIFAKRKNFEKHLTYQRYTGVFGNQFANYISLKDTKSSGSALDILQTYKDRRNFYINDHFLVFKKYLHIGLFTNIFMLLVGFGMQYFVIQDVVFGTLLIGQATLITAQIFRLQGNIKGLAEFLPEQYENVIAAKYIFLYLDTQEHVEKTDAKKAVCTTNDIICKDIVFSYPEIRFEAMRALSDDLDSVSEKYFGLKKEEVVVSEKKDNSFVLSIPYLHITKGERVAIVGKNGNGKTTFIQLMLNLYQPQSGTIEVFGNILDETNQSDVQGFYSVLFQDYGQTNFTVDKYIALSEINNPDIERVKKAAEKATASSFIEKWPHTYTQQLGISFKGVKPSKGQWQKLALARAFYKEAPVLILDEPTSAIDAISAKKIFENIATASAESIVLFVCHNMADIPIAATRILVFDEGKIIGDGTHENLLTDCPVYKELYESEVTR